MKKTMIILTAVALVCGCARKRMAADASGTFESTEILVSAEANGRIVDLKLNEGDELFAGQQVATIDTTLLSLQWKELTAQIKGFQSQTLAADAQVAVIRQQIENLSIDLKRFQNMVQDRAATQKQLDDLTGALKVARTQLQSARAQKMSAEAQLEALEAKKGLLKEQIRRSQVNNPVDGTVLEKYIEESELTAAGKPLYKIADLKNMILRVYVSGGQLGSIHIGQSCTALIDRGNKYQEYPGQIAWISEQAEFTPKIIQTKEERINLVYAVKVRVENDGAIKIGMPGEVIF